MAEQKSVVATLIDFDNIYITLKKDLRESDYDWTDLPGHFRRISKNQGEIVFAKAYANWANRGIPIMTSFGRNLIKLEHVFPKTNGTDRSDSSIIIDAMKLLYTQKKITHFILFSGDSDFRELAVEIMSEGKTIVVCSFSSNIAADLRLAADYNFIPLENELGLTGLVKSSPMIDSVDYGPLIRSINNLRTWEFIGWTRYRDTYLAANYPSIDWASHGSKGIQGNKDDFLERAVQDGVITVGDASYQGATVKAILLNRKDNLVKEILSTTA